MKVSEPEKASNAVYIQGLKNRLIALVDASTDEEVLEQCLQLLESSERKMPCVFTDEEFEEELRLSEESGFGSYEDALRVFGKWDF